MSRRALICLISLALLSLTACRSAKPKPVASATASGEEIADSLRAFVHHRVDIEKQDVGIVVGMVDERGSCVVSCGKLDNGSDQQVNGDTLFEIGSVTKVFTGLLLQDMVERGQMKLDDPVAMYLPTSVKVPAYHGKQITLLQLATHTSGLPDGPDNLNPKRADNSRADYDFEKLSTFVSGYQLSREPGSKYEYSTVGIALLAQAIAFKAGQDYESLVTDRICRPLQMDSTRITLTPELKSRFATGHNYYGYDTAHTDWNALAGGAALRSTANDLLKFISANLGLTPSGLTPLMDKTHVPLFRAHLDADTDVDTDIGLTWMIMHDSANTTIIGHGGLTRGFTAFLGFDQTRRRGVVVLCNSLDLDASRIGRLLLESQWHAERRPQASKISSPVDPYVGQYKISPAQATGPLSRHTLGIRREGDRLFLQILGPATWPKHVLTPPITDELPPASEDTLFERLSGVPLTFSRDAHGAVTSFTGRYQDHPFAYIKTSDQPPDIPAPPQPSVAITLDIPHLDACAGDYAFPPDAANPTGMQLTLRREGDHLIGQASGENALQGDFDVYPASETDFFINVDGAHLTFIKNATGEVTAITHNDPGSKGRTGRKIK